MLRRRDIDITLIHESHLRTNDVNRLQNKFYRVVASSSDGTKTVILMKRALNIKIDHVSQDKSG